MYFINFAKCYVCNQKKSVATQKNSKRNICADCDKEFYDSVAENQKSFYLKGNRGKNARNR